jgi:hypothetical protein
MELHPQWLQSSTAALQIRVKKLYREDFGTFEDYAETILGLSRVHAHRFAEAGRVIQLLSAMGDLPVLSAPARPLTRVGPELVPVVWRRAPADLSVTCC